ncbi:hypothetical protein OIO90_000367 [Microbotryomycetes sp. JL221]|nr:hypothetical protein OIO90_000367 [Microbotryomycetes sp. JL221]
MFLIVMQERLAHRKREVLEQNGSWTASTVSSSSTARVTDSPSSTPVVLVVEAIDSAQQHDSESSAAFVRQVTLEGEQQGSQSSNSTDAERARATIEPRVPPSTNPTGRRRQRQSSVSEEATRASTDEDEAVSASNLDRRTRKRHRRSNRTEDTPSTSGGTNSDMPQLVNDLVASSSNGHDPATNGATRDGPHQRSSGAAADDFEMSSSTISNSIDAASKGKFVPLWPDSTIDRQEFIRLTLQTLNEMGLKESAVALTNESGVRLESPLVTSFRDGLLEGQWSTVEKLLLGLPSQDITDLKTIQFQIRQQKFLEVLEARETKKALSILRNELAPLGHDSDRLHFLSSLIMCGSPEDLRSRAGWAGVAGGSRTALLNTLQNYIPPNLMIPRRRLETLLEQAKEQQRRNCPFHSGDVPISLLSDCKCDPATFPSLTSYVLHEHTDEIWRLEFSHDGKWLATAGRDQTAIIWNVAAGFTVDKILREHTDPISCLTWSPDDSILLTAAEMQIKMWNAETGTCIATLTEHEYQIGALSWLPNGQGFVSGGMDSKVFFWDLAGNVTGRLANSPSRVIDLAISPDGSKLVAVGRADTTSPSRGSSHQQSRTGTPSTSQNGPPIHARHDKKISVYSLPDNRLILESVQPNELTHAPSEILYVDLRDGTIVRRFQGHDQGQYVLQSCFGGALQNFVMSGSGDGQIFVWHRDTGRLLHQLSGHGSGSVNAVAWNKRHAEGMFASASDDRTIRIWTVPTAQASLATDDTEALAGKLKAEGVLPPVT